MKNISNALYCATSVTILMMSLFLTACGGAPPIPPDADKDGVLDSMDQCPSTPGVATLAGCPDKDADGVQDAQDKCPAAKGLAKYSGCPDTDNDGLPDNTDKCPAQAEDKDNFQDTDGCPDTDNDNDGVADVDDACPNARGLSSWKGCPSTALTLYFLPLTARLKPGSLGDLDAMIELLNSGSFSNIEVQGHTDSVKGIDSLKTVTLSQQRAETVRGYLVKNGVNDALITAVGYGDTRNVVSADQVAAITDKQEQEEARSKNRRVEFRLTFGTVATTDIDAGAIRNDNAAKGLCPRVAKTSKWTGQWKTTVQGQMSVCECQIGKTTPTMHLLEAGPIWNNDDAKSKCVIACSKPRWTGQWKTTVEGRMSVCQVTLPGVYSANSTSSSTAQKLTLDTVVNWGNGKAFITKGGQYTRFDVASDKADTSYPKALSNATWPGVPFSSYDAIVNWGNGKVYIFKGSQYVRFDINANKADDGYPKAIDKGTWKGLGFTSVDAAVNWGNGKVYIFKGNQYVRFDIGTDQADPGYPKTIDNGTWKGLGFTSVDTATNWGNGKVYFTKGSQYTSFDIALDKADANYPQPLNDRTWSGLKF